MVRKIRRLIGLYRLLWIEDRVQDLYDHCDLLTRRVQPLESITNNEMTALRTQVDHLLSHAEVSPELITEFQEWKAAHPVPEVPLVSVCVATYNRSRLLTERCIASVLKQSYDRLELIVVGDGCTDETPEAVTRIGDPRLRFVNLPERGCYPADPMLRWMVAGTPAMNHAMSLAQGQYVTHLDDDDEYTEDRLEKLVAFSREHGCDFVWHPFWGEDSDGQWVLREAPEFALGQVTTSSVFYRSWLKRFTWNLDAYQLREPGDWNRFRRIKHVRPVSMRYPEPLLKHYREGSQRN